MDSPEERLLATINNEIQANQKAEAQDNNLFPLDAALERIPGSIQAFLMDRLQGYFTHVKLI